MSTQSFIGFYWFLLGFICFCWVLLVFVALYWFLSLFITFVDFCLEISFYGILEAVLSLGGSI